MSDKVTLQQLKPYLWNSANYLRNKIDAGDYKSYIFPLMFYKRICDVYDEEYQTSLSESNGDVSYALSPINHRFQIPKNSHWNDLRKVTKDVGQKILRSMRAIEKTNPDLLYGIFGDANWGNKERFSDEILIDLVEHFSTLTLSNKTVSNDLMGMSYEFLIKKFADDSGHTAAEFYTNRTIVTLMSELLDPQPSESVYDPTCGTGGMLLECVNHLKKRSKEYRNVRLFGQEKNIITSTIARMNMLLHGFEDAKIGRNDTLSNPLFLKDDKLQLFDVILANPPYSISKWDRKRWEHDPYNRNIYGTPPQGRADYAFIQHIIKSLSKRGRAAVLLPHGVLFREGEEKIREKLIRDDKLESVIGLPKDMFYNSPMEACIMIFKQKKTGKRKDHVLFIYAFKDFERIDKKNFLNETHIEKISTAYEQFITTGNFSYVASNSEIQQNECLLNIPLYVKHKSERQNSTAKEIIEKWKMSKKGLLYSLKDLSKQLRDSND